MKKVLVLEDEANIRSFVVINLKRAGYEAIEAETGEEALAQLKRNPDIKVALLDIMLPDMDGFEVCRRIRASDSNIGIIMLTARTQEMDKVTGLMTGADDYVTKPFSPAELTARIDALYRRTALLGLRFNERCSFGLEDFVFNAAAYRRISKAVYIPQVVYRHFEGTQSTSCARSAQALLGRIRALEPWMEAEFHAAQRWCDADELQVVWKDRRAQAVTFLMHQLRDAHAPGAIRRRAWQTLRQVLGPYPGGMVDILHDAGHNKKQTVALLLYQMRLQRLYDLLPVREEQL